MEQIFKTGDKVPETGMYVCDMNGLEKSFKEGETFDLCPQTWSNTNWHKKSDSE